jgi:DNA-directed RNA polymerase specialized sigma24 family protein
MMLVKDLVFALMLVMTIGFAAGCWLLERRLARMRRIHQEQGRALAEALAQLEAARLAEVPEASATGGEGSAFAEKLAEAHLKNRLQAGGGEGKIPEKYRLVAAMARRGLSPEDISDILKISPGETEQLIKLAKIG